MANVLGTAAANFIHRNGDGQTGSGTQILGVTALADTIQALAGDDIVFADAGNDTVLGGEGNDILHGGQGADLLQGGLGNDSFRIQGVSDISGLAETIDGGNDTDRLDFFTLGAVGAVNLALATITGVEELAISQNIVTIRAVQLGAFSTILATGFAERFLLSGLGTADLTDARIEGIDEFRGNAGANGIILTDVAQAQFVNLLAGNDTMLGGLGNDTALGGAGLDRLVGDAGNDQLDGGNDADTLDGGDGNDLLIGGGGVDSVTAGLGNDTIQIRLPSEANGLADTMNGGADTDYLQVSGPGTVGLAAATLIGFERLVVFDVQLVMTGTQFSAFDSIGGSGFAERLILSAPGTMNLTGATINNIDELRGSAGSDVITILDVLERQFIDGRLGADKITGGAGFDTLVGGDGNDTVDGSAGQDIVIGGQGVDLTLGGIGNDTFRYQGVSDISGIAETVNGGADIDTIDLFTLGATGPVNLATATLIGVEVLRILDNVVTISGSQLTGFDSILGSGFVEVLNVTGGGTVNLSDLALFSIDNLNFTTGNDVVILTGAPIGQTITTGDGDDTVLGGNGGDVITGGLGRDSLVGSGGADRYVYNSITETTVATPDRLDFIKIDGDQIDLLAIDADLSLAGNQGFLFVGTAAFTGAVRELRYTNGVGITTVEGDIDGNGGADFRIELNGTVTLNGADFVL